MVENEVLTSNFDTTKQGTLVIAHYYSSINNTYVIVLDYRLMGRGTSFGDSISRRFHGPCICILLQNKLGSVKIKCMSEPSNSILALRMFNRTPLFNIRGRVYNMKYAMFWFTFHHPSSFNS